MKSVPRTRNHAISAHRPGEGVPGIVFEGRWLQSPKFRGLTYHQQMHEDRKPKFRTGVQNVHTLLRRVFTVDKPVKKAVIHLTADDVYHLYINSTFVGVGPAPAYLFKYPYNSFDVTRLLRAGETNAIAAHVYYQGCFNIAYTSGDNLQGFLCQLEIDYEDGSRSVIASDSRWKALDCDAWTGERGFGYDTHIAEDFDLRRYPCGWQSPAFDDSAWGAPDTPANPCPPFYTLVPQSTPAVTFYEVKPERLVRTAPDRLFIDLGKEVVGHLRFRLKGISGHVVEVRHAEELSGTNEARFEMRCNCKYQEYITLAGRDGGDEFEFFEYRGFRYAELLNLPCAPEDVEITVVARNYPFEPNGRFTTSNPTLSAILGICEQGVRVGTQETYLDCPTREKGGFMGDGLITALSHIIFTGDPAVYRKFIEDLISSARINPGLCAESPTYLTAEISDYSMIFPLIVSNYVYWTGDKSILPAALAAIEGLIDRYRPCINKDGLLEGLAGLNPRSHIMVMVDWPENLRDGYEHEQAKTRVCALSNQFYYACLSTAASLYAMAGSAQRASERHADAEIVKKALLEKVADNNTGLYPDYIGSTHFSLHAQALPLMFGIVPESGAKPLVDFLKTRRIGCGVYFTYFLINGLLNVGEDAYAAELLLCEDERSWVNMLRAGATTCMEAWGPDQKWNTSWCHPWSSTPVIALWRMLGVIPFDLGYRAITVAPRLPASLGDLRLEFKTPVGTMVAEVKGNEYAVTLPRPITARIALPGTHPYDEELDAGTHRFTIERA